MNLTVRRGLYSNNGFDLPLGWPHYQQSRLIGQHKLVVSGFYSYIQRYLSSHQEHITQILAYLIQSCHDMVPPDELKPVVSSNRLTLPLFNSWPHFYPMKKVRAIANNFISDASGPELIQVGLNSVREIFVRCPLLLSEDGMGDFVQDLVMYKKYKRDKGVVMIARSILNTVRELHPSLLKRKDRGRDTGNVLCNTMQPTLHYRFFIKFFFSDMSVEPLEYGQERQSAVMKGLELLEKVSARFDGP